VNDEEQDKNPLMNFVADEDDKHKLKDYGKNN
jgi:hypothetical protein